MRGGAGDHHCTAVSEAPVEGLNRLIVGAVGEHWKRQSIPGVNGQRLIDELDGCAGTGPITGEEVERRHAGDGEVTGARNHVVHRVVAVEAVLNPLKRTDRGPVVSGAVRGLVQPQHLHDETHLVHSTDRKLASVLVECHAPESGAPCRRCGLFVDEGVLHQPARVHHELAAGNLPVVVHCGQAHLGGMPQVDTSARSHGARCTEEDHGAEDDCESKRCFSFHRDPPKNSAPKL